MRLTTALLLMPAVALAQQQIPLRDNIEAWYAKAKSYIPTAATAPVDAGAASVASRHVTTLTTSNWQSTLKATPGAGPETWMVLVTGGNKTCEGKCDTINAAWNETAALFSADATAPKMGLIDCEDQRVLCSIWLTGPPSLWYIQLPSLAEGETAAPTDLYVKHLNLTTTTAAEIARFHTGKEFAGKEPVDSWFHPFDGQLAQWGLNVPMGYVIFLFSMIPSWSFMLILSFVTRSLMNSRVGTGSQRRTPGMAGNAPQGGAPAANNL